MNAPYKYNKLGAKNGKGAYSPKIAWTPISCGDNVSKEGGTKDNHHGDGHEDQWTTFD